MPRVLIIDDEVSVVEVLISAIKKSLLDLDCVPESGFAAAADLLKKEVFDAVVLDLRQGTDLPGQPIWRDIWTRRFCPIVIYTAVSGELDPPLPKDHAFVKRIKKGSGSETKVVEVLKTFEPQIVAIARLHEELHIMVQRALRDTAGSGIVTGDEPAHLVHAVRRRVAALMDSKSATEGRELFSWEQYLIPPIGDSPLTGDLLRKRAASWQDPNAYRLVLTPSCDMVREQKPCATVLVATCCGAEGVIAACPSLSSKDPVAAERVRTQVLSPGHFSGMLPLPQFPGVVPLLGARLKDLQVIPYESIGAEGADAYERVASIDSPFREQVSWAFLTTVARPGLPDRDLASWAAELVGMRPAPPPTAAPATRARGKAKS